MKKFLLLIFMMFPLYTALADPNLKTQIQGLIDRQDTSWISQDDGNPLFTMNNVEQFPGLFAGVVINTSWAALQPNSPDELDVSTITGPLKLIEIYNSQLSDGQQPLAAKLRVWSGANAPKWAKSLDGAPITICRNPVGTCTATPNCTCPLTVGRFWDVNGKYVQAWRALQQKLADQFDNEPLIRQVAVTSCTQQTDEPFVPTVDTTSRNTLYNSSLPSPPRLGYRDADQEICLKSAAQMDYAPWKKTLIDFSFGPFSYMDPGQKGQDMTVTEDVMDGCILNLKGQCIIDAQAVGKKGQNIDTPIFSVIASRAAWGASVNLQTASPVGMGNAPHQPPDMTIWSNAFSMANQLGAKGLEVWSEKNYDGLDAMSMLQACSLLNILLPGQTPKPPC